MISEESSSLPNTRNKLDQSEKPKLYSKPRIIHELELETRAGSPLGIDPFDETVFGDGSGK